jgi:hypothetical protein
MATVTKRTAAVGQMNRAARLAAQKPQGMAWKAQLEVIANAMAANVPIDYAVRYAK